MSDFNIVVYNNLPLYSLLSELKFFFNIKLNLHINEKNNLIKFIEKNPNTLVLSSEKLANQINSLIITKPTKIGILIENINIILSKSKFKNQSKFIVSNYYLDINSRFLFKNEAKLKLTEKEVDLILYLKNSKTEKSSQDLQKDIWRHVAEVETHTVETHIYRLRKKISDKFEDNNFIINNKKGYKLENWKKEIILQKAYYLEGLDKKKLNQKKVKEVLKEKKSNLL